MSGLPPDTENRAGIVVVAPREDIDIATAAPLAEWILEAVPNDARGAVLDLSRVRYVDSAGIRMLYGLTERLRRRRQRLRLVVPDDGAVRRVLDIVRFGVTAPVDSSVEAAVTGISTAATRG